ncbi:class I SAM-dependent methyltransferase [Spirosoma endophyticum]|uniref:Methyltransferase domain-containing protein n=1 Tax=Spirosoma endophyticum TaxID=662367 RepID=A0A1I1RAC8_9BACT|nr:methyltransferase domain-containing protein [Spirosoma endophyticum]SFD31334.1 Methyltransferase domain-containing protein [Spirosoma endophyticum]
MIGRSEEYEKMFRLEGQLWWYRHLHERVVDALEQYSGNRRDIRILDAGCGTGGMLDFLRQRGYSNLKGIDGSVDAVAFCHERGLPVTFINLNDLASFEPDVQYDAIICNDVFCYFSDPDLSNLLAALAHRLKPDGILISNNNAFQAFQGQHDLAVGIIRRFVLADFKRLMPTAGLRIKQATYWSFLLSPLILGMRQWQRLQLALGWRAPEEAQSDVYLPSTWLNETLYKIVRIEQKTLRRTPFGSSLFIVVESRQSPVDKG